MGADSQSRTAHRKPHIGGGAELKTLTAWKRPANRVSAHIDHRNQAEKGNEDENIDREFDHVVWSSLEARNELRLTA